MGSRIREKPERLFEVFVEIANPQGDDKDPFIIQRFPEDYDDKEALAMIPKFAYPCETDASQVDHFTFVLTDIESMFRFGYCRHATGHQTCLCVVSCLPWCEVFFKLLDLLASITNSTEQDTRSLTDFLTATYDLEVPLPDIPVTIVAGENMFNFTSPKQNVLPSIPKSRNLTEYYNAVDLSNMMRIFACMIQERRIYMTSKKLSRLTACIHAAEALLYPMHWQHLYIPVLPAHLIDYISAPMPYLIGVHSNLVEKLKVNRVDVADAVIVDLDANTVTSEYDDLENMPEDVSSRLKKNLHTDVVRKSMTEDGDAISVAFLQALVKLIGGYREALTFRHKEPITFDPEAFVRSRPSQSTQAYLEGMLALQIFQQFIYGRLEILNSGCGFTDIFDQLALEYSDKKGNTQSTYKEWLKKGGRKGREMFSGIKGKVKSHSKKAFAKISSITDNDERRGSQNPYNVSGGTAYSKEGRLSNVPISEDRRPKRPPRPPAPSGTDPNRSSTNGEKEDSQDDSHLRLSYQSVDVSLMGDHDIQAAMMKSSSAEALPKNGECWSGSTSTISSDSRSVDDTDSANIPFGSLQSSDDESQSSLMDVPAVSYKSQSPNTSHTSIRSEPSTGDRLILKKKPNAAARSASSPTAAKKPTLPPRVPINQSPPAPAATTPAASNARKSTTAEVAQPLRPPPRKPVASRQPIAQDHMLQKQHQPQQQSSVAATTTTTATTSPPTDAPLISFESSESETTDSEVFDPLALPKSGGRTAAGVAGTKAPLMQTSSDISSLMSDVGIREKREDSQTADAAALPGALQRGGNSRSSLSRSKAFRRESNKFPLRKGSSVDNEQKDDEIDGFGAVIIAGSGSKEADHAPIFDLSSPTPVAQTKPRRDSSADLMKHEWSLASLAPGPRMYLPSNAAAIGSHSSSSVGVGGGAHGPPIGQLRQNTLPATSTFPPQPSMYTPTTPRGHLVHQTSMSAVGRGGGGGNQSPPPPYRSKPLSSSIQHTRGASPIASSQQPSHMSSSFNNQRNPSPSPAPSPSTFLSSKQPTSSSSFAKSSSASPSFTPGYQRSSLMTSAATTATANTNTTNMAAKPPIRPFSHQQQPQSVFATSGQTGQCSSFTTSAAGAASTAARQQHHAKPPMNSAFGMKPQHAFASSSSTPAATTKASDPFSDLLDIQFGTSSSSSSNQKQPQTTSILQQQQQQQQQQQLPPVTANPPRPPPPPSATAAVSWETFE